MQTVEPTYIDNTIDNTATLAVENDMTSHMQQFSMLL